MPALTSSQDKSAFLQAHGFPPEWETWGFYPNELFVTQQEAASSGDRGATLEHLRYGAFLWWLRQSGPLPADTLLRLSRLAAMDPDPGMSSAAIYDILFHPTASEDLLDVIGDLVPRSAACGWGPDREARLRNFAEALAHGRRHRAEREAASRVARDLAQLQLTESELRELFALDIPLVLLGLVEHPRLPQDLLEVLSQRSGSKHAKAIRHLATLRLAGKRWQFSDYAQRYADVAWRGHR